MRRSLFLSSETEVPGTQTPNSVSWHPQKYKENVPKVFSDLFQKKRELEIKMSNQGMMKQIIWNSNMM